MDGRMGGSSSHSFLYLISGKHTDHTTLNTENSVRVEREFLEGNIAIYHSADYYTADIQAAACPFEALTKTEFDYFAHARELSSSRPLGN